MASLQGRIRKKAASNLSDIEIAIQKDEVNSRSMRMKKWMILILALVISLSAVVVFAQYTGSELERKPPENLYPNAGPGDMLIVDQLKETNRLLQEQLTLLTNQNRLLIDTLNEMRRQQAQKPAKHK